ncbi:MAG: hypothetical protein IPN03_05970 [Holophagales bacterium]|nr:hypothetical protein [Holophagales bacterium]
MDAPRLLPALVDGQDEAAVEELLVDLSMAVVVGKIITGLRRGTPA